MSKRAWMSASLGVPVILTDTLLDGDTFMAGDPIGTAGTTVLLGTRPRTERELARYRGKWIAQQGLIDWLAYIGEKPIPKHPRTHQDVLRALRAHP